MVRTKADPFLSAKKRFEKKSREWAKLLLPSGKEPFSFRVRRFVAFVCWYKEAAHQAWLLGEAPLDLDSNAAIVFRNPAIEVMVQEYDSQLRKKLDEAYAILVATAGNSSAWAVHRTLDLLRELKSSFADYVAALRRGYDEDEHRELMELNRHLHEVIEVTAQKTAQNALKGKMESQKKRKQGKASVWSGKQQIVLAALVEYHQLYSTSVENSEPATVAEIAKKAEVNKGTVSRFFKKAFGGYSQYKAYCLEGALGMRLAVLIGDVPSLREAQGGYMEMKRRG